MLISRIYLFVGLFVCLFFCFVLFSYIPKGRGGGGGGGRDGYSTKFCTGML